MFSEENNQPLLNQNKIVTLEKLTSLLNKVRKNWILFFFVGLLAGLLGFYYAYNKVPIYKSKLTFALDDGSEGGLSGAMNLAAQLGLSSNSGSSIFSSDNIIEILKSRQIIERAFLSVETFNNKPYTLIGYYLEKNKSVSAKGEKIAFPPGQSKESFSTLQKQAFYDAYKQFITSNIAASRPDKKLSIYELNVSTTDEKLSKVFTDRILSETNDFYIEICSKKEKKTLDALEERANSIKESLGESVIAKASNEDANLNPAFSSTTVPMVKQQLNIQAYGGAYAELFKNLEMARFQYLNKIPLLQVIDGADYPMEKIKPSKLKSAIIFSTVSIMLLLIIFWIIELWKTTPPEININTEK